MAKASYLLIVAGVVVLLAASIFTAAQVATAQPLENLTDGEIEDRFGSGVDIEGVRELVERGWTETEIQDFLTGLGGGEEFVCPDPGPELSCPPETFFCNGSVVFQCEGSENACGGSIIYTVKRFSCTNEYRPKTGVDENGCTVRLCDLVNQTVEGPFYILESTYLTCGDYNRCTVSGAVDEQGWSEAAACECSGSCYPAPETKDVGDETLLTQNVFDGSNKVKLPVNLGWEDNVVKEIQIDECPIGSYKYEVAGNGNTVVGVENENLESIVESCKLLLAQEYKWKVQACLDAHGEDCGDWSNEGNFQSSTAPELKLPFDIDFEGEQSGTAPFPVTLEWCSDLKANSYKLNAYEVLSLDPLVKKQVILSGTSGSTKYYDSSKKGGLNQLSKGTTYLWEISSCNSQGCGIFSQLWSLIPGGELSSPLLLEPPLGAFVNMEDVLKWRNVIFASHFLIDIKELSSSLFVQNSEYSFQNFWNKLSLNTQYTWRVASCGGAPSSRNIEDCKREDGTIPWSEERTFTTTGAVPTNLRATPTESGRTAIPFTLSWSARGAAAYVYEVLNNGNIVTKGKTENSNVLIRYEDAPQGMFNKNTTYSWRVKTCANKQGTVCGEWATSTLTTANLSPPTIILPKTDVAEILRTIHMGWSKVFSGNFYEHELTYASLSSPLLENPETSSYCSGDIGNAVNGIKSTVTINKDLRCTGEYRLRVRACVDEKCTLTGEWSSPTSFTVKETPVPKGIYGLVPCGLGINNPNTPWDERESCGFGHIMLLVRNLVDFALWKLSVTIIVLMTVITGATMFFSFGGTNLLVQIKSIWRAVGVGVLILLFAWTLLNLLLGVLGFNVGIFGNWYEIPL